MSATPIFERLTIDCHTNISEPLTALLKNYESRTVPLIYITISTFTSVRPYGGVVGGVRPVPSRPVPLPIFIMFRVPEAQSDRC